jgi:activator of HSP90 ATPase
LPRVFEVKREIPVKNQVNQEPRMIEQKDVKMRALDSPSTRRQLITGSAVALGSLVLASEAIAGSQPQQTMTEKPDTGDKSIALHQAVDFTAAPQRIYEVLLDAKQFSAFSGATASISREAGGAFSLFGGHIIGRNVELVPNQRIVQAWRVVMWDEGVYSIARFELKAQGLGTRLIFDHIGFPEGKKQHLESGWKENYWEKLRKYLG